MSNRIWIPAGAITLILVAGVIAVQATPPEPARPPTVPAEASGALEHLVAADALAASWSEDARLIRVHATEGVLLARAADPPFLYDTSGDAVVGDGLALAWTFAYLASDRPHETYFATIGGDGSTLYARALDTPYCCYDAVLEASPAVHHGTNDTTSTRPAELTATFDASGAAASLADRPEFAGFGEDHPVFQAAFELAPRYDGAAWLVTFHTAMGYSATGVVDADDGEVLEVYAYPSWTPPCCPTPPTPVPPTPTDPPQPCCRPEDVREEFSGRVGGTSGLFDAYFEMGDAAWLSSLTVVATLGDTLPGESYVLDVADGHGRIVGRATGSDTLVVELTEAPSAWGRYSAYVYPDGLSAREATVDLKVAALFADAPDLGGSAYTFHGDAWGGGYSSWLSLDLQREVPVELALSWEPTLGSEFELVLVDRLGNEVASVRSDKASLGPQTLVLAVEDPEPWGMSVEVRQHGTASIGSFSTTPWTLGVLTAPWEGQDPRYHPYMH